jgi:ribosome-associated protein
MDGLKVGRFTVPEAEIQETFTTSGGPGGQHANRSETAVELRFDLAGSDAFPPTEKGVMLDRLGAVVVVTASESRSQWRNRSAARRRLVARLEQALRTSKQRRPTKPTRAARQNRLESKRRQSEKKRLRQKPDW